MHGPYVVARSLSSHMTRFAHEMNSHFGSIIHTLIWHCDSPGRRGRLWLMMQSTKLNFLDKVKSLAYEFFIFTSTF